MKLRMLFIVIISLFFAMSALAGGGECKGGKTASAKKDCCLEKSATASVAKSGVKIMTVGDKAHADCDMKECPKEKCEMMKGAKASAECTMDKTHCNMKTASAKMDCCKDNPAKGAKADNTSKSSKKTITQVVNKEK